MLERAKDGAHSEDNMMLDEEYYVPKDEDFRHLTVCLQKAIDDILAPNEKVKNAEEVARDKDVISAFLDMYSSFADRKELWRRMSDKYGFYQQDSKVEIEASVIIMSAFYAGVKPPFIQERKSQ